MRAERLVAIVLLLQARTRVTAAELAGELEVSVATARRDLEALSAAGVPVYPQTGRGGGWQLVGGARTDLTGLTEPQARELFLLLGPAAAGRPDATAALAKLRQALPASFRNNAAAASMAVLVDRDGWGEHRPERPELAATLEQSVIERAELRLDYRSRRAVAGSGPPEQPVVRPWAVVNKGDRWYLLAEHSAPPRPSGGTSARRGGAGADELDHSEPRTYRVDRIRSAQRTGAHFAAPDNARVRGAWDSAVTRIEALRAAVAADIRLPDRLVPVFRQLFGRHFAVDPGPAAGQPPGPEPPGPQPPGPERPGPERLVRGGPQRLVRGRLSAHTALALAEQLAGFGGSIDVVGPAEVRAALARIGTELVHRYANA